MEFRHCPSCGNPLERKIAEGRSRAYCPACRSICYEQLNVGAGALIEKNGRLLLLQRAHDPFKGAWNLPAGYCEVDESPPQTAAREVLEETGLRVEIGTLEDVYSFDDDPRGNGILILYRCRVIDGMLGDTSEAINPTYFAADEIPGKLAGGAHDKAILAWQKKVRSR